MSKKTMMSMLRIFSTVGIVVLIFYLFLFMGVVVGESMDNTLHEGDILYGVNYKNIPLEISSGKIIGFKKVIYGTEEAVIKRVIGVPGDHVQLVEEKVYVNGELLKETYIREPMEYLLLESEYTLNEGEYFVMGDNRNDSMDSRAFGPVLEEEIWSVLLVAGQGPGGLSLEKLW